MNHLGDLLSAHLDGAATPEERSRIDQHLSECATCRSELAAVTLARDAIQALPMLEVPAPVRPARRFARPALAWAVSGVAAAALALGIVLAPGDDGATIDLDTLRDQHTARVIVDPGISTVRAPVGEP